MGGGEKYLKELRRVIGIYDNRNSRIPSTRHWQGVLLVENPDGFVGMLGHLRIERYMIRIRQFVGGGSGGVVTVGKEAVHKGLHWQRLSEHHLSNRPIYVQFLRNSGLYQLH